MGLRAATVMLALVGGQLSAQSIRGGVFRTESATPIAGATVLSADSVPLAMTDSAGRFRIASPGRGPIRIRIRAVGFALLDTLVAPTDEGARPYSFQLTPLAQALPERTVVGARPAPAKFREFEERRAAGFGRFISDSMLAKNETRQLSEVVATLPGLRIVRGMGSAGWVAGTRGSGSSKSPSPSESDVRKGARPACYSTVMLDGGYVYSGRPGELLFDLNSLGVTQIAGIEYYAGASTVPLKYRGADSGCGLLIIWTK